MLNIIKRLLDRDSELRPGSKLARETWADFAQRQYRYYALGWPFGVLRPGSAYAVSEPEFVGALPVRREIEVLPKTYQHPSQAEIEFAEHGSIALRLPASIADEPWDNTIDRTWTLTRGGTVLVRGREGGFWMVPLRGSSKGWHVICGNTKVPVVFCEVRDRWVIKELV